MCSNKFKDEYFKQLDDFIDSLESKESELITILHKAQDIFGYLPEEVQKHIALKLNESLAHIYGVITFYSFFTMVPRGKYPISVCMGTACYVRGSQAVLDQFQKELNISAGHLTSDGKFSLDVLRCIGACGIAPAVMVGDKIYQKVEVNQVKKILDEYQ